MHTNFYGHFLPTLLAEAGHGFVSPPSVVPLSPLCLDSQCTGKLVSFFDLVYLWKSLLVLSPQYGDVFKGIRPVRH